MTTGGWFVMLCSVGFVTVLFTYCVTRVLCGVRPDHELGHVEPVHEDEAAKD
ncbi:MAG: hypothetical protein Q8M02_14845 [Candidatus Didemnitutus sp.]|nr:hypothetical protein [Candidatus Didemnitutus sp.]